LLDEPSGKLDLALGRLLGSFPEGCLSLGMKPRLVYTPRRDPAAKDAKHSVAVDSIAEVG